MTKNLRECNFFTTFAAEMKVINILILPTYDLFDRIHFPEQ